MFFSDPESPLKLGVISLHLSQALIFPQFFLSIMTFTKPYFLPSYYFFLILQSLIYSCPSSQFCFSYFISYCYRKYIAYNLSS